MFNKFLILTATLFFSFVASAQNAAHGTLMVVKGEITVNNKDGASEKAKVGKKVFSGDSITAGKESRAKIVMSDNNVINVNPDTQFIIEKYENDGTNKQVSLNVQFGKIRASVEQKYDGEKNQFNIKTPTAVAGVRGTDFLTSFDAKTQSSSIVTFSGVVAVGTPGPKGQIMNPVFVKPGEMTSNKRGEAPAPPAAVPANQLQNMNQESSADNAKPAAGKEQAANNSDKEKKKDEGDKKPEQNKENAPVAQDKKDAPNREPASIGPVSDSMVDKVDMEVGGVAKDISGQLNNGGSGPKPPPVFIPPAVTTANSQPIIPKTPESVSAKATVIIKLEPK